MRLKRDQDAFGCAVSDHYHRRGDEAELIERDDGFLGTDDAAKYLDPYRRWPACQRRAIRLARGRVLDIGCGAGRHALWLQDRGHDVLGIDLSPLAIKTAKLRGVRYARVLSITEVTVRLGRFDTILLFGNNFGLFANDRRARFLLRRFRGLVADGGCILAESRDIYRTDDPVHLRYQRGNRARRRMSGQIRLRVRYRELATPWFDYLMVSRQEMQRIVAGTGWRVSATLDGDGPQYVAVLEKSS